MGYCREGRSGVLQGGSKCSGKRMMPLQNLHLNTLTDFFNVKNLKFYDLGNSEN